MLRKSKDTRSTAVSDGPRRTDFLSRLASGDPGTGFHWMAAGMQEYLTLELGIRDRPWPTVDHFVARHRRNLRRFRLGDREIVINLRPDLQRLDPAEYDRVVMLSPWEVDSLINRDMTFVMSNAYMDPNPDLFRQRTRRGDLIAVADSGGYQLKTRQFKSKKRRGITAGRFDPVATTHWGNAASDLAFVLDIAPRPQCDDGKLEVLRALARATRETCRIMMAEKADSLRLLNIAHGDTFGLARPWVDIVIDDGYVGWGTPLSDQNSVRTGILLITEYKVKWVHFLGFSDPQHLPLVAWLGRHALVTCDSSSYLQGRKTRSYRWPDLDGNLITLRQFTKSYKGVRRPIAMALPCPCPVCEVFRYGDLFARDIPVFGSLMNLHNLSTTSRYVATLNAIASQPNMTPEKYCKKVVAPYGERAVGLFDYLLIAMDRGLVAAEREALTWSGERSYHNLFPTPTDRCREVLVPTGTAADRQTADCLTAEVDVLLDPEGDDPTDDPTVAEAIRLFQVDYSRLLHEQTRYYAVLAILTKRWTLRLPTMAVGLTRAGIHQLYINPTFYCRVDEAEHRMAILMHEVHHIVLGHCVATEWPQYVLNQPASFMIACELAANTHVSLPLPNRPSRPILPASYGLPDGLTTLEYFLQVRDDTALQRRARSAAGRIRRRNAGRLPEVVSGSARSKCPAVTDLAVLRAAAEVGEDERGIAAVLSQKRPPERPDERPESLPEVEVVVDHAVPTDDWLAEHSITIQGDIRDGHVFARILNVLVEDVTRGYSLGGTFRSRTFRRPNRRQANAFGVPGVHKTGGGPALELDLCFLIDATSSMRPYIENVANSLWWMVNRLSRWRSIGWRVGLTWYRDCGCDASFFCQHPFTQNIAQVKHHLESLRADGGGDEPESAGYALYHAARRDEVTFDYPTVRTIDPWRPSAKRVVFLVTDASCHLEDLGVSFRDAVQAALRANVHVYVLGPWSWQPYQQICQATKGKLFRVES